MSRDLAIFLSGYGKGGVERMLVRLALGFARERGLAVDFLVPKGELPYVEQLETHVRVFRHERDDPAGQLQAYLECERPARLVTGKPEDEALAVGVLTRAGLEVPLYCRIGVPQLHRVRQRSRNPLRRWWLRRRLRATYRNVDGFLVVSRATGDELTGPLGVAPERVHVLPNPVIDDDLYAAAAAPCPHPWLEDGGAPVILGVGGFRRQKDFPTLIRAFAAVRARRPVRLVILGEGRQRQRMERLIRRLGVQDDVALPGFTDNPYAYMRRAALFALSSRWEGQPNVLIEAMALGTPAVATDCVSGPRDILGDGRFGALAPVADPQALAQAIEKTLASPPSPAVLREAVSDYTLTASAEAYALALGLGARDSRAGPARSSIRRTSVPGH
ncbi:glycosyltransferase [Arhodomonas sp. AD133]|uniref:glycosyltransferase n=1 Tax=Arhodomonas sp. AD133 TaxID=3415009 RepID=UPI003EBD4843